MFRRLLVLARDGRLALAGTLLIGFLAGLLAIAQASGLSRLVEGAFLLRRDLPGSLPGFAWLGVIVLLRALLAWAGERSAKVVAVRVKDSLHGRIFDKLLRLGPAFSRREQTGELVTAAVEGVEALDAYYSQYLPQLVAAAIVPLSILVVVFPRDLLSGLVLLVTAPLIPVFMSLIGRAAEKLTRRQWDTLSRLGAHFYDSLQGLTTLKELGRSREQADSIASTSERFRDATLKVLRITFLSAFVLELVATVSTALVAVEVSLRLLYGHMDFRPAFFLLLLAPEFYLPLRMLGLRFHAGMAGTTAARRIFELLDLPEGRPVPAGAGQISSFQSIRLSNVTVTYPGATTPALDDVSLEIRAGEAVALVGLSGAGKSTLAGLLMGFIQPDQGQVLVDGQPLDSITLHGWRSLLAWVPQNPTLFHGSIRENLLLARPGASGEDIQAALSAARLDEFNRSLPLGIETILGEAGVNISGGQVQRLALARAFLKAPSLLLLDEPTSSLDPLQETRVVAATRELMQGRTVLTIAHRLNTVRHADRIFVLDHGRLVESGTHADLLARHGSYARLVGQLGDEPGKDLVDNETPTRNMIPTQAFRSGAGPILIGSSKTPVFLRLLSFLQGSWAWVLLSVLLGSLTVGSNVGLMGLSAFLVSSAALHPELGSLQAAIAGVRFFGISRGVFRYAERLSAHNTTFRLLARLRPWFYRCLEPLAPARLAEYRSGDLLARITSDVDQLENFFVRVVSPPLVALVAAAGMAIFFARISMGMAWASLGFALFTGVVVPLLSWVSSRQAGQAAVTRRAALQARLVESIRGIGELLSFNRQQDVTADLREEGTALGKAQVRLASIGGLFSALSGLLANACMLTILALGIPLVTTGKLPGVMLATAAVAALAGLEAALPLSQSASLTALSMQAGRRLFELVDAKPVVKDPLQGGKELSLTGHPAADLKITGLGFSYPGRREPALQDASLVLPFRKRIAIVGASGAGKSTLASLLLRFWEYQAGEILLDGKDLRSLPQDQVRSMFSTVSQRAHLFNDSLRNNLLLARPSASREELERAVDSACLQDLISSLRAGMDTLIGEHGMRLSAGERQRLVLARAFLRDAPIYLFDEPTANLDLITERAVLQALLARTGSRSLLLFTHRLVDLEAMDEILVLEGGHIVERGTQPALLAKKGIYTALWDAQRGYLDFSTTS